MRHSFYIIHMKVLYLRTYCYFPNNLLQFQVFSGPVVGHCIHLIIQLFILKFITCMPTYTKLPWEGLSNWGRVTCIITWSCYYYLITIEGTLMTYFLAGVRESVHLYFRTIIASKNSCTGTFTIMRY